MLRSHPRLSSLLWCCLALSAFWAIGPWALVAALLVMVMTRRSRILIALTLAAALLLPGLLIAVPLALPEGLLPLLPAPGALWMAQQGRVAEGVHPQPIDAEKPPQNPALAPNGTNSMHNDPWATDAYPWGGPTSNAVEVSTAAYGILECATTTFDRKGRIVGLCGTVSGMTLRVLDPETLRPLASMDLPERRPSDLPPWQDLCAGAYFYLDSADRAILLTADQQVLQVSTVAESGKPDLSIERTWDLTGDVKVGDCAVALMPDWSGRIWWVTQAGLVGTLDPTTGVSSVKDLGEVITNSLAADADGSVFVVSDHALYSMRAGLDGAPRVQWRTPYDRGTRHKPGLLSQGSGTTPTVLNDGLIAIADNAEPQMNVIFLDRDTGQEKCKVPVFGEGQSGTENSLVSLGDAVVVENNYGYDGPQSTILGRAPVGGLARVDAASCKVAWTSAEIAPTSVPKVSWLNGVVYAYTKVPSLSGVAAWYFTGLDARTGKVVLSVRTGTGLMANNHYAAISISPEGVAYVPTMGGMVRIYQKQDWDYDQMDGN